MSDQLSPTASPRLRGAWRVRSSVLALLSVFLLVSVGAPVAAQSIDQIADELDASGRYVEFPITDEIDEAIDLVNAEGVAFAWLDTDRVAEDIATDLAIELDDRGSRYKSVLVLTNVGVWAESFSVDVEPAADASFEAFSRGAVAQGLEIFADTLAGRTSDSTQVGSAPADGAEPDDAGGSTGLPGWVWLVMLALVGFIGFRLIAGRRKKSKAEADLLELDRTEVREQVRDNADRVIDLGDKVIASGDAELIRTYEEASRTFTEVSSEVDGVTSIEAMDRLDDRMDHAEWQFEVIEAKLEGRTPPTAPETSDAGQGPTTPANQPSGRQPPPPGSGGGSSALDPDGSVVVNRPRTRSRHRAPRRRSGGMGGMGGGLGSVLGGIILGGGLGRPRTSRRSQQRRASTGSWTGGRNRNSDGGFGELGGGVLRRGGSGSTRSGSRTRSGGGGTFRRGRGGGGSF